jgi:membrane protein
MTELQNALNDAWGVSPDKNRGIVSSFLFKRLLSAAMILVVALLLFGFLVASAVLARASNYMTDWMPQGISVMMLHVANFLVSFIVTTILMVLVFQILPDAEIGWGDVAIGAFVTAVLFMLGKWAMATYLANSDAGDAFGAAGALAVVLIWVYYSSCILLLGAEFTQAWTTRDGREVKPERGAVRVPKDEGSLG